MSELYGSADLNEEDEMRPLEFTLDTPTVPGPYSSSIQNIFARHCAEIRTQSETQIGSIHQISRKRLKDLIAIQNNELFKFLQKPDRTPHPNGIAEAIFRRYGHDIPSLNRTNTSISRDLNVDASMNSVITEINTQLERHGGTTYNDLIQQLKWIFIQYRTIGEEILRIESILTQKTEVLDKLHQRMPMITSLSSNEVLPELLESFKKYLEQVFQDSKFEEYYIKLTELYKKWIVLREIIGLQQSIINDQNEPICSICIQDSVTHVIVPCGHTFCTGCSRKMNMVCYICRGNIREKIKLYLS